jgi:hypothetical protein
MRRRLAGGHARLEELALEQDESPRQASGPMYGAAYVSGVRGAPEHVFVP